MNYDTVMKSSGVGGGGAGVVLWYFQTIT